MKKVLLSIFAGVLSVGMANAQCTPNPDYATASGYFFPDSVTFVTDHSAMGGVAYDEVIDIKTLTDTTVNNPLGGGAIVAYLKAFKIFSVTGSPAGFTYTEGGAAFDGTQWNNGWSNPNDPTTITQVQGCLGITASAADVSAAAPMEGYTDYPITVLVDAQIAKTEPPLSAFENKWLSQLQSSGVPGVGPLPVDDYVIRVHAPNGVAELLSMNKFDVAQSYPNPASDRAVIALNTPGQDEIEVKVYNVLGSVVYLSKFISKKGRNNVELNTGSWSSGLYIYTVSNGSNTVTKKMTVK